MAVKNSKRKARSTDTIVLSESRTGVELKLAADASIYIDTGNSQNQGARPYQEDSFGYTNITDSSTVSSKGLFAILADGMGGLSNGKNVADFVVQSAIAMFDSINPKADIQAQLQNIARIINQNVYETYSDSAGSSKAGATLVLAYIFKNRMYWVTVGDSRLYCFRNGHLIQMNEDHDYKNQLYREYIDGCGSREDAETDRQKDSLVCFMGKKENPYMDSSVRGYRINPNDVFVLCSDGIYNAISQDSMMEILSSCDAQSASDKIVSQVVAARLPGQDNMTVMVIKCGK